MTGVGPGSTVLVTGGASGIGLGIVGAFASRGARVIVADLDGEPLRRVASVTEGIVEPYALDVRDREGWAELVSGLERRGIAVDVLVSNAGVGFLTPALESTFAQWDWVMDINLGGAYNAIRSIAPGMVERGRGHIVATASIGGLLGAPGAVYAAAKSGVVGLMEALRAELLGTGVGTSLLVPGVVRTNIANGPPPPGDRDERSPATGNALEHAMSPEHVGELVVRGVERDEFYLLTHSEHRSYLERRFAAILRALPEEPAPPGRAEIERSIFDLPIYDAPQDAGAAGGDGAEGRDGR